MHQNIIDWTKTRVEYYRLTDTDVLEIGSRDVNGTSRGLFKGKYIGIDFIEGAGVDMVMNAHNLQFADASFDVVICQEMLEHDSAFWITLGEIARVLRSHGHLFISTRGNGFAEHGWPEDYWRFMPNSGKLLAELARCDILSDEADPYAPGLLLHGVRRRNV